jgi:hypothetical protein
MAERAPRDRLRISPAHNGGCEQVPGYRYDLGGLARKSSATTEFLTTIIFAGLSGELAHHGRRRNRSRFDRSRKTQRFVPVFVNQTDVGCAADHRVERRIGLACVHDIQATIGKIANARRESKSREMAKTRHVIDGARCVSVTLTDIQRALVVKQTNQNMSGLTGVGGNELGVERRIPRRSSS